jgi:hypothetical protein
METPSSGKATFIVQVQFNQNESWQGTVAWTEQKKEKRFRSTLELIRLLDQAITTTQDDAEDSAQWK